MSERNILKAYGAEIDYRRHKGNEGAIAKAKKSLQEIPNSFIQDSSLIRRTQRHTETTGPEMRKDTDGNVDIFIAVSVQENTDRCC